MVNVVDALEVLGGVAPRSSLVTLVGRRRVDRAVADGLVIEAGAALALPAVHHHVRRAHEVSGVLSHLSAAQAWGIPVVWPPQEATVTVPRHRTVRRSPKDVAVVFADLEPDEVVDGRTSPLRTVIDCSRRLPFAEALAVADGALRLGLVDPDELVVAAGRLRGRGAPQARATAKAASGLAANPFESALRAIALEVGLLDLEP